MMVHDKMNRTQGRRMATQTVNQENTNKSSRGVKNNPEVENFYRFVQENDLRREANMIFTEIVKFMKPQKKRRRKKKLQ